MIFKATNGPVYISSKDFSDVICVDVIRDETCKIRLICTFLK